jgi:hypothetical protein
MTKIYYDCEFLEDGERIHLISIGMVAEDGREFYETFVAAFSKAMHEAIIDGASDDDATRAALAVVVRYVQRREAEYYARRFKENRDNETSAARRAAYAHAVVIAEVRRRWLDNREGSTP